MIIAIIAIAWFTLSTLLVVAICINKSRVEDAQEELLDEAIEDDI